MPIVLGLDLETDSVENDTALIVEMGLVLWDTDTKKILRAESFLVDTPEIPPEVTKIHGITAEETQRHGIGTMEAMQKFDSYLSQCSYIVAHNGTNFDRMIMERYYEKLNFEKLKANWIDTMTDIPFPEEIKVKRLTYLAAEHGFINPFPHRALFDVMTMLKVMSGYNFEEIIAYSKQPMVRLVADIRYERKEEAKARSYKWDAEKREWYKEMKLFRVDKEMTEAPFPIKITT
jgi:DNA polymerase III alpha subunit (gram-positive type)